MACVILLNIFSNNNCYYNDNPYCNLELLQKTQLKAALLLYLLLLHQPHSPPPPRFLLRWMAGLWCVHGAHAEDAAAVEVVVVGFPSILVEDELKD